MVSVNNIDNLVQYVNLELQKNPKATVNKLCDKIGIKQSTFKSRVHRANYIFDFKKRIYVKEDNIAVKKLNSSIEYENKTIKANDYTMQKYNKSIDVDALNELISLLEPIKEVIEEYKKNKDIIDIKPIELELTNITEVKQKLFKVDVKVLDKWERFVADHRQYKIQNLVSLALDEFVEKYK